MPKLSAVHSPFNGVTIIDRSPTADQRGMFERLYCAEELADFIQGRTLSQINRSLTHKKGVVRGLHYQEKPYAETKVITCLRGEVFDVAVDMRPNSPTYLNWFGIVLSEKKACSIIILETTANSDGVHNLTIDSTAGDLQDLLKKMDTGLLVTELMGQGVNILTGDYSRGATGFWVENGVIQFPVEEITIAGNMKDMFQHIVAVGSDVNPNIATRCGSILLEEMMIAGDA